MADHDQSSGRWWQSNSGAVAAAIAFVVVVTGLIVAMDRSGFFGPVPGDSESPEEVAVPATRLEPPAQEVERPIPAVTAPASPAAPISITGNFSGNEVRTAGYTEGMSFTLQLSLHQRNGAVYGNYSNSAGDAGSVQGSVEGETFSGRIESLMLPGNFCNFTAEIKKDGAVIQGDFDCASGDQSRFTLTRH
jgi:hypothetical protein